MPVRDSALTTLVNFKSAHGVTTTADDTLIESLIDRASLWIEEQTGRLLKARNYNGYNDTGADFEHKTTGSDDTVASEDYIHFDGDRGEHDERGFGVMYLPQFPIIEVESAKRNKVNHPNAITFVLERLDDRGSAVVGNEIWETLVRFDDYILESARGKITLLGGSFTSGHRNYRVTATAGYTAGTAVDTQPYVPSDLEALAVHIAGKLYREDIDMISEKSGPSAKQYVELAKDSYVQSILANYRNHEIV